MSKKSLIWTLGAFIVLAASVNVGMNLFGNNAERDLFLANVESLAEGEHYQGCEAAKEIVTGQKFKLETLDFGVGLSIGDFTDPAEMISLGVEGRLSTEMSDCYAVICYPGAGSACCLTMRWTVCVEAGCPETGLWTTNP